MSKKHKNKYEEAISAGATINSDYDEQVVGLSADGKTMYVYFDHIKQFGDIYSCRKNSNNFIAPERVSTVINSDALETSGTITPDGKIIYFASNREEGYGGLDIYMTRKLPDGSWAKAQNLGRRVNTKHDEDSPTPSPDGKGLYFCSQGHANFGGFDLFYTEWNATKTAFTRPRNLGYPINTPEDNRTISFSDNRKFAYISAIRDEGYGDLDIYKIVLDTVEPNLALIRMTLPDMGKNHLFVNDTLYIAEENNQRRALRYLPNQNGVYSIILERGEYDLWMDLEGYEPYKHTMSLDENNLHPNVKEKVVQLVTKQH